MTDLFEQHNGTTGSAQASAIPAWICRMTPFFFCKEMGSQAKGR